MHSFKKKNVYLDKKYEENDYFGFILQDNVTETVSQLTKASF